MNDHIYDRTKFDLPKNYFNLFKNVMFLKYLGKKLSFLTNSDFILTLKVPVLNDFFYQKI